MGVCLKAFKRKLYILRKHYYCSIPRICVFRIGFLGTNMGKIMVGKLVKRSMLKKKKKQLLDPYTQSTMGIYGKNNRKHSWIIASWPDF